MIYILMLWTVVSASDSPGTPPKAYYDWRPLGEFHYSAKPPETAQEKCEIAARQLGLKPDVYRCVRSK